MFTIMLHRLIPIAVLAVPLCLWMLIRLAKDRPDREGEAFAKGADVVLPVRARPSPQALLLLWLGGTIFLHVLGILFLSYGSPGLFTFDFSLGLNLLFSACLIGWPVGLVLIWTTPGERLERKIEISAILTLGCLGSWLSRLIPIAILTIPLCLWMLVRFVRAKPLPRPLFFIWLGGTILLDFLQFLLPFYRGTSVLWTLVYLSLGFLVSACLIGWPVGLLLIWTTPGKRLKWKIGVSAVLTLGCLGSCAILGILWLLLHIAP